MSASIKDTYGWSYLPSDLPESGSVRPLNKNLEGYISRSSRVLNEEANTNRGRNEARSVSLKIGLFKDQLFSSSGSAYLELGGRTKVLATVRGPLPVTENSSESLTWSNTLTKPPISNDLLDVLDETSSGLATDTIEVDASGRLVVHLQYLPFATRKITAPLATISSSLERLIHKALVPAILLDMYANSTIEINLVVLEDDGSLLAALISASSAALADAGIHMRDIVIASSCLVLENLFADSRLILIDPSWADEMSVYHDNLSSKSPIFSSDTARYANITLSYLPSLNKIAHLHLEGTNLTADALLEAVDWCQEASRQNYSIFKSVLVSSER